MLYRKVDSPNNTQRTITSLNSIITQANTIELSKTPTQTPIPLYTEGIINKCTSDSISLPEIRSNLDAFYYANQDVRVCGTILQYHIFDNKDAIIHIDLNQKEDVDFPFDVRITIPSEINKFIYLFFESNKNIESCFKGTLKYRDTPLDYKDETLTLVVLNEDDICLP